MRIEITKILKKIIFKAILDKFFSEMKDPPVENERYSPKNPEYVEYPDEDSDEYYDEDSE